MPYLLLITVFVVSTCGLVYELIAGTLSSYLLGDSVTQFSTVIGVYLFSMGVGAFLSKFVTRDLLKLFIRIEILTGLVGGFSSITLFVCFAYTDSFLIVLYSLVFITGLLIGMEIPLIMRILNDKIEFKDLVSKVFTFDYIGALLASLLFPLFFVPAMGLVRTSAFFGILNVGLAIYLAMYFRKEVNSYSWLVFQGVAAIILLLAGFVFSNELMSFSESKIFGENVIYSTSSRYQRIVVTRKPGNVCLYLNNNLQFASADEYRYHEALVHPCFKYAANVKKVLILGGGDGMAARELLKYPFVQSIKLVDLDKSLTNLFRENAVMSRLNDHSLSHPKLTVVNDDAFQWLRHCKEKYDLIIIDFPDPSNFAVGKLYTNTFYRHLQNAMTFSTVAVVQSTSPLYACKSFWCVENTLHSTGLFTLPYHVYVPSFGEWGFFLFSLSPLQEAVHAIMPEGLKFYSPEEFERMKHFPKDMLYHSTEIQRLDNQVLVNLFEEEWSQYQ